MMTKSRDGPRAAAAVRSASRAVEQALRAWLIPPWRPGDSSLTEAEVVIYDPADAKHEFKLALDAKRAKAGQGTLHLPLGSFYQPEKLDEESPEASDGESPWFLRDSLDVRRHLEEEVQTLVGVEGIFEGGAKVLEQYRKKALRALAPALRGWKWLRKELGPKQCRVELLGGEAEPTGLVISTGTVEVTRFDVTFVNKRAGADVLLLSQALFWHPAVIPWEVLDQDQTWETLQEALEPRFQK